MTGDIRRSASFQPESLSNSSMGTALNPSCRLEPRRRNSTNSFSIGSDPRTICQQLMDVNLAKRRQI